jgi:hypothetical protein
MKEVASLADLDAAPVTAGDFIMVGGFAGGLFLARTLDEIVAESTVTVRFLPYCYTGLLKVLRGGTPNDTITIGTKTITLVASDPGLDQIEVADSATDLAESILSYVNDRSDTFDVRVRGGTTLRITANATGPSGNLGVSATKAGADATFSWEDSRKDPITELVDPCKNRTISFGDQTITFKASGATGLQVNIGNNHIQNSEFFRDRINFLKTTLYFKADDGLKPGDIKLEATGTNKKVGLKRLRKIAKGEDCNLLVVQSLTGAAADRECIVTDPQSPDDLTGALYRPSAASATVVNVRVSVDRDKMLHPSFWNLKGERSYDDDYILPRMQAMFDAAHFLGCDIQLRAGANYDITRGDGYSYIYRKEMDAIRFHNVGLYGNGATITNRNDYKRDPNDPNPPPPPPPPPPAYVVPEPGEASEQNSVFYVGIGHPAFDCEVPFARILAASAGDTYVDLLVNGTVSFFRIGDVIPIMTVAGRSGNTNWHPIVRDFYRIVDISNTRLFLDRGLTANFPAHSRAALWTGHYDGTSKQDLFIADNPRMRDLSFYSPFGGATIRSQAYDVDVELDAIEAYYGVFYNALNGHVKVKKVRAKKKICDLAQNSQGVTVEIDEGEWWPNDTSDDAPLMHFSENSRDFVISCKLLRCASSGDQPDFPGPQIINATDGARGSLKLGITFVEKMVNGVTNRGNWAVGKTLLFNDIVTATVNDETGQYVCRRSHTAVGPEFKDELRLWAPQVRRQFFTLLDKDSLPGEAPHDFTDLDLDFGQVFYGEEPGTLIRIQDEAVSPLHGPKRIRILGGKFHGAVPLDGLGAHISADDCGIDEGVHIPGALRVDGDGGVYGGHFTGGYSAASTGAPTRVAISCDATPELTKRVTGLAAINSVDPANTYPGGTLVLAPGTFSGPGMRSNSRSAMRSTAWRAPRTSSCLPHLPTLRCNSPRSPYRAARRPLAKQFSACAVPVLTSYSSPPSIGKAMPSRKRRCGPCRTWKTKTTPSPSRCACSSTPAAAPSSRAC